MLNLDHYGNTSAASIPLALTAAATAGRLSDGDLVVMTGFGAGMTWGTAVFRWGSGSSATPSTPVDDHQEPT